MVFLLELFQPSRIIYLIMAFRAADCGSEYSRLISDGVIVQGESLTDAIFHPLGQCPLNVREFTFGSSDWRSIAFFLDEILVFVSQDFGDGT